MFINLAIVSKKEVRGQDLHKFKLATLHGEVDQIFDEKAPISLENVLGQEEGKQLQCVLVEGAPGSGKTTLAWEISQRWAKGELFQNYMMVLLLRLRDQGVQSAETIEDLILHRDKSYQQEIAKHVTESAGDNTLIILEGLDELPKHFLTEASIFTVLLSGTDLPLATILVTSRPSATGHLCQRWKKRISRHIEILGFTEDNIDKYIHSVLDEEEIPQFHHYISTTPSIRRLMYIPLHTAIVIEIYRTLTDRCKPLPTSLTSLYKALAQTILQRYLSTHPDYKDDKKYMNIDKFEDLPQDVYFDFYKLAQLAYDGVRNQILIFKEQRCTIQHLGFMQATPELFKTHKRGTTYSYNFLHLSVQEFMAAYYISQQDTHKQERLLQSFTTKEHLQNTTKLLAGLTNIRGLNEDVVKRAIERECKEDDNGTLELSTYALTIVYETENASVLSGHRRYTYKLNEYTPHYEYAALGYCIAHSNYKWLLQLGRLYQYMQSTEGVRLLIQAMNNYSNCSYIIESIVCYYEELRCVEILLTGVPHCLLQQVETLELLSATRQSLPEWLLKLVPSLDKLHTLELGSAEGIVLTRTVQELTRRDTVKVLELEDCDPTAYIPPLCQWLTTSTQLKTLWIADLPPSAIESLCTSATPISLKTLWLQHSQFSLPAMQALSTMLKTSSITEVVLRGCGISDEARKVFEETKKVNKHVKMSIKY